MTGELEFRLLGPLEVLHHGRAVPVRAAKQRVLLAALLVDANRVVPVEVLVGRLWNTAPPRSARNTLQNYVMRLRGTVGESVGAGLIETRPEGYLIEVGRDAVDLHRFRALVRTATSAAAEPERASQLTAEALAMWRGPPLLDVPSEVLHRDLVPALDELRLAAVEVGIAADMRLGQPRDLIGELRELTAANPLREGLWAQLMLALYQAGRQAEALECYQEVAELLAEELGVDPGLRLRELHQGVLTNDPRLRPAAEPWNPGWAAAAAPVGPIPPVPIPAGRPPATYAMSPGTPRAGPIGRNDLPADVPDLVGREEDLRALLARLPASLDGVPTVIAINGMAGVGKTAFAVRAARHLTDRYPDAELFLGLHGHSVGREPTEPAVALETMLCKLNVPDNQIPDTPEERSGLWRAALAGRRALVLLDDTASAAQVRPLLPGSAGCLVLITSRRRLTDLDTTHTYTLDVLSPAAASELFTRIVGADRIAGHPQAEAEALQEVLRLCGYLPLAIRVAAARLRDRPAWRVVHLAGRLRDEQRRLAELATGDRSVAAELGLSYQHLTCPQQRLFRLLGLVPGDSFDVHLAAALASGRLPAVEDLLEDLVDVHLLQQPSPGRYRLPGLVRAHASSQALPAEPAALREAARRRLLDFYLHTATAAVRLCQPASPWPALPEPAPGVRPLAFADERQAATWLDVEADSLRAALAIAGDNPELYAIPLRDLLAATRPSPRD